MKPLSKRLRAMVVVIAGFIVASVFIIPLLSELRTISAVREQFLLEDAVNTKVINDPVHKPTVEKVLDPKFMKRYNLSTKDYLDSKGYFAPNEEHWAKWKIETKTAAILMWRKSEAPSAWDVRRIIRRIDAYYSRNDKETPVVKVVDAATAP
jgi:hypothetical protein